jgi:hypothetical protein
MLATAATTCRNCLLLPLQEGQSKSSKLEDEQQTSNQPDHAHEDCTTPQSRDWSGVQPSTSPWGRSAEQALKRTLTVANCARLKLSMGD